MRRFGLVIAAVVLSLPATAHAGVPTAALGHITLRSTDGVTVGYVLTGVYNSGAFDCGLKNPPSGPPYVECVDLQTDPLIDWECTHFLLTATAPAPGTVGVGAVRGRVDCESATDLDTQYVVSPGTHMADNYAPPPVTLGLATIVRCWAFGLTDQDDPTGSWEVDCWEPGVANPLG